MLISLSKRSSLMVNPGISVILPVRNGARFLDEAVASIVCQTDPDFELLLIDDNSTDETPQIIAEWKKRDKRIRCPAAPAPGIVHALNAGLAAARGALVARMDADDIAMPDRFARQRHFLDQHPEVTALGTCAEEIDADGVMRGPVTMPEGIDATHAALAHGSPLLHPTVMMRRDIVHAIGGYRDCCRWAEDYDLWLRLARVARIGNLPDRLLKLRRHAGQVSRQRRLQQRAAAALARRLADSHGEPPEPLQNALTPASLLAYLETIEPGRTLDRQAARDFEVMLRSSSRDAPLTPGQILTFRRAFVSLGVLRSAATLLKIAVGR